ncbi:MAG: redoxin domain-containing protein [Pseudomonadota bacterium]
MIKQIAFLVSFLVLVSFTGARAQTAAPDTALIYSPLKDMTGKTIQIRNCFGEKITAIVFWSTWSRDSGTMLTMMQEFYEKYKTKGLQVISICVEKEIIDASNLATIKKVLDEQRITFVTANDDGLKMFRANNIIAVPTAIILDASQKIIAHLSGYSVSTKMQISTLLDKKIDLNTQKYSHPTDYVPVKDAVRYYNMALMEYKKEKYRNAKEYAEMACGLDALFEKPLSLLSEIALEEERWNDADVFIEKGMKIDPKSSSYEAMKYFILANNGKSSEAKNLLDNLIQKDSVNTLAVIFYAYILGREGRIDESMQYFSKAEVIDPAEGRIYMFRRKINKQTGNAEFVKKDSHKLRELIKQ